MTVQYLDSELSAIVSKLNALSKQVPPDAREGMERKIMALAKRTESALEYLRGLPDLDGD